MRSLLCSLTASFCRIVFFEQAYLRQTKHAWVVGNLDTLLQPNAQPEPQLATGAKESGTTELVVYRKLLRTSSKNQNSRIQTQFFLTWSLPMRAKLGSRQSNSKAKKLFSNSTREWKWPLFPRKVFFTLSTGKLEKPSKVLHGPAVKKLEVLGQFEGNLSHGSRHIRQTIVVVKSLHKNLLGLPAITALDLVHKVNTYTTGAQVSDNSFMERFPKVFQGLGTLGGWVYDQVARRCTTILIVHSKEGTVSFTWQSSGRTWAHGKIRSHLEGRGSYTMVRQSSRGA